MTHLTAHGSDVVVNGQSFLQHGRELVTETSPVLLSHLVLEAVQNLTPRDSPVSARHGFDGTVHAYHTNPLSYTESGLITTCQSYVV